MRSAHWVEPFWAATTLPVNTTSPSFWMFSSWSASTVTGPLRPDAARARSTRGAPAAGAWERTGPTRGRQRAPPPRPRGRRPPSVGSRAPALSREPGNAGALLERRADPPLDAADLLGHLRLEAGAVDHRARPIDHHRILGPGALRLRVPAETVGLEPEAVARDQDHVAAQLHVLGLLIQVALVAGDGPRARRLIALGRLVHLDGHLLHRRLVLLLERLGVLRVELPLRAVPALLLQVDLLQPVVRIGWGGLGGQRPGHPGPMNEHTHHHR